MPNGREVTPIDELTKQPLSLLVKPGDFYAEGKKCIPEYHHQQHPGNDEDLGNDEFGNLLSPGEPSRMEGLAVRYSKGQMLPYWLHFEYHDIFHGPVLPKTSKEKHTSVLLGVAKVIPTEAIYIHEPGAWQKVRLTKDEHDFIRRTTFYENAGKTEAYNNRRGRIGSFLASYALQNSLPQIFDDRTVALNIESFLELDGQYAKLTRLKREEYDPELKQNLATKKRQTLQQLSAAGEAIIHQAIIASVEEARPLYEAAIRARMVQGTKRDLGQLAIKFYGRNRFPQASEELRLHILAAKQGSSLQTGVNEVELQAA